MAARTQTRLVTTEGKDVSDGEWETATLLILRLLTHKWMKIGFGSLHLIAPYPVKIHKLVYQLPKEVERRVIVMSYNHLRWKAAKALPNQRKCSNKQQDVLSSSFKNCRYFFWNSAFRYTLFPFSSAADNLAASRKLSSAMGAKDEGLGSKQASDFSSTGRLKLSLIFCSKQ